MPCGPSGMPKVKRTVVPSKLVVTLAGFPAGSVFTVSTAKLVNGGPGRARRADGTSQAVVAARDAEIEPDGRAIEERLRRRRLAGVERGGAIDVETREHGPLRPLRADRARRPVIAGRNALFPNSSLGTHC